MLSHLFVVKLYSSAAVLRPNIEWVLLFMVERCTNDEPLVFYFIFIKLMNSFNGCYVETILFLSLI